MAETVRDLLQPHPADAPAILAPERPTLLAYLPETSVVVVAADWIEPAYEDAWESVRAMPGGVPRSVNFVTGPSRTADIAQQLELGAHGPRRLLILIVEQLEP